MRFESGETPQADDSENGKEPEEVAHHESAYDSAKGGVLYTLFLTKFVKSSGSSHSTIINTHDLGNKNLQKETVFYGSRRA